MNISKFLIMGKWSFFRKKEKKEKEVRYILSLDGGGMRGIIPAYILSRMEKDLKESFGDPRPLYSHFDLIAGTSTGSLIALALSLPAENTSFSKKDSTYSVYEKFITSGFFKKEESIFKGEIEELTSADEILEIYLTQGSEIFKTPHNLMNIFGPIFNDRYDGKAFDSFLYKTFGDTPLSDCKVPTIAVAFNTNTSMPFIFSSSNSHGFLAREAARASSAAPTYFPAATMIDRSTSESLVLIDGGIAANNPTLLAYKEARELYPNADVFKVLSISTDAPKHSQEVQNATSGAVGWASPVFKAYGEAQGAITDLISSSIKDMEYTRVWAPVLERKIKLDDYSKTSIDTLIDAAEKTYTATKDDIFKFLDSISKEKTHECVKLKNAPQLLPR